MNTKTVCLMLCALSGASLTGFSQQPGTKVWEYFAGTNAYPGSPSLGPDGTIYFIGNNASGLYAIDTNGNLKAHIGSVNGFSPTIAGDGTVYVFHFNDPTLYAYDPTLTNTVTAVFTAAANITSDIVLGADGTFYFAKDWELYAVNSDGTLKWQYRLPVGSAVGRISLSTDGTVYFSGGSKLYALTPSGAKKWAFPAPPEYGYAAIGKDGTIYMGYAKLYALFPESSNPNGTKKWEFDAGNASFAPVIAADGTIYIAGQNSALYAVNPDGIKKWEFQTGGQIHRRSAAIGSDGTIYVGSNDHFLYAINPDGSYRWGFETGGPVESSPVVGADGTVYVGSSDGKLYAIRGDAVSADSPWPMFGRDLRRSGRVSCPKGTPCFDTVRMMTNGAFDMVLIGKPGTAYGFDVSTNLTDWCPLTNIASANGAIHFVDDTATNYPNRFYRAATP